MKRWSTRRRFSAHQLQLDWTAATDSKNAQPSNRSDDSRAIGVEPVQSSPSVDDAPASNVATKAENAGTRMPVSCSPDTLMHPELVQVLPWDFLNSFPEPMEDAIDAGVMSEQDCEPNQIKSFHEDVARNLLNVLAEQDQLSDARRRGVDPKTGKAPTTKASKERLRRYFESEPRQQERTWQTVMGAYEAAFGEEAVAAFDKAIRARHAGIAIVAEATDQTRAVKTEAHAERNSSVAPAPNQIHIKRAGNDARRIIARLPVPKPLPHAVKAGHFGQDEEGPVNPSADEVRDITLNHAEELMDLISAQQDADRSGGEDLQSQLANSLQAAVSKYAEDFGFAAAEQLLAYARRQVRLQAVPIRIGPAR